MKWYARVLISLPFAVFATRCRVSAPSAELNIDDLPHLSVQEELRIGSFDDPDLGFSRISSVEVDRDGQIYVMEALAREIRVFTPDGELLRRIGGPGEGPGEFQSTPSFGVVGDTVWAVGGMSSDRLTLFDRQGAVLTAAHIEAVRLPLPSCFGHLGPVDMRGDGLFISELNSIRCSRDDPETGVERGDRIPVPRVLFDATGTVVDTVGWDPSPPPHMVPPPGMSTPFKPPIQVGSTRVQVPTPPSALPRWFPLLDGRIIVDVPRPETAESGTFSVTRRGLSGDTVYHREIRYSPVRYTSGDLDSIAAQGARRGTGVYIGGRPADAIPEGRDLQTAIGLIREEMEFPEFRVPVEAPRVGRDAAVWVRRADPLGSGAAHWIVLDPEGVPRGELELARNVRILWSAGDTFFVAEPDDFDVPWLVKYRIQGG